MLNITDKYGLGMGEDRRWLRWGERKLLPWPFPVVMMLHSSATIVFGRDVYSSDGWWVKPAHRVFTRISNAKYWCKYRLLPWRYHWVDTGLEPGYYDYDHLMLHACMSLLSRYIEEGMGGAEKVDEFNAELREAPDPNEPTGWSSAQADRQEESVLIYRWWKIEKPADEKRRRELRRQLYGGKRVTWEPTEHPYLSQAVFRPFEGDEIALEAEFRALEKKIDADEEENLIRLVKIRHHLWT